MMMEREIVGRDTTTTDRSSAAVVEDAAGHTALHSEEGRPSEQREVMSLDDLFRDTKLTGSESLEVKRESHASSLLGAAVYAITLGVIGSLVASAIFEFYVGPLLRSWP